jgi:excisionase family DNA binding protein
MKMNYLNLNELADYIKVSKSTAYKWCSNGQIPYIKTGKLLLFKKDAIDLWLDQYNVPSREQVVNNVSKLLKQKIK